MRVQVAVPEVIDGAAGTAHDEGSSEEEGRGAQNGCRGRHGRGEGRGHEGGEETGEEEVVGADRLVDAHQLGIGNPGLWEEGEGLGRGVDGGWVRRCKCLLSWRLDVVVKQRQLLLGESLFCGMIR